jgi:hypothetical protein
MAEALQLLRALGPWALLVLVIVFVATNPEKTERLAGWALGFFSWAGRGLHHRSIKVTIQGQINTFARSMDTEVEGCMPFNMRLDFVTEVDRAELEPTEQTVIVRIRDRLHDDRNIVHAMLAFCTVGVVPQARCFLQDAMNSAIDLTITRKLLNTQKHYSALHYLYNEVVPACSRAKPDLDRFCRMFDTLDEDGLFTRVVLAEVRDFGARIETRYPEESHGVEAAQFVNYVHDVGTREAHEDSASVGHLGRYIRTAFVFIGIGVKMAEARETPYMNHLRRLRAMGYEKAYLAARGGSQRGETSASMEMTQYVADLAQSSKLATRGRTMRYSVMDPEGRSRETMLIEMTIIPLTRSDSTQQALFSSP